MSNTITFSESAKGWPSYYSFIPDWILGMNNYLYTFKGGNLYRHNTNETRNTFYYDWWVQEGTPNNAFEPSSLITVFNESPLENKIYKTISIVGDAPWYITDISTDLQSGGYIDSAWFEKKEASYFAYVRNPNATPASVTEYPLRSLNGIGRSASVTGIAAATRINFAIGNSPVSIGSIISVGDSLYYAVAPYTTPVYCGEVIDINVNYVSGDNYIEVNTTVTGGSVPPGQSDYFLSIKNQIAESHGVLGHYSLIEMENSSTSKIELFVLESEIMKSNP
jgi:hypothetical protein